MAARYVLSGFAALALLAGAPVLGSTLAEREAGALSPTAASHPNEGADGVAGDAASTEDFVGVLLAPQMANLSPRTEATVSEIRAKVGEAVRKDAVLVAFDLRIARHDLAIAEAQLAQARADAAAATAELASARKRAERRSGDVNLDGRSVALVSGEELAQSRFDAESAAARAAAASARIAEIGSRVDQLRLVLHENELRAPFDGVVSAINLEPGMSAHVGQVVARVVGGQGLRARIAVSETASGRLATCRRLRLTTDDRVLFATIDQVPPEPDPVSRTFVVEGRIDDFEHACRGPCSALMGRAVRATFLCE